MPAQRCLQKGLLLVMVRGQWPGSHSRDEGEGSARCGKIAQVRGPDMAARTWAQRRVWPGGSETCSVNSPQTLGDPKRVCGCNEGGRWRTYIVVLEGVEEVPS